MKSAWAGQSDCSSSGSDGSHSGPVRRQTTKNIYATVGFIRSASALSTFALDRGGVAEEPPERLAGDHEQADGSHRDHRRRARRLRQQRDLAEEVARLERGDPAALPARFDRPVDEHEELAPLHALRDQLRAGRLVELVAERGDLAELLARAAREQRHGPQQLDLGVAAELHAVNPTRPAATARPASALEDAAGAAADPDACHPAQRDGTGDQPVVRPHFAADEDQDDDLEREDDDEDGRRQLERAGR